MPLASVFCAVYCRPNHVFCRLAETAGYDTDHAHAEEFEGAPYYGVSLILRNKITLRFYYKSVEGYVHTDNVLQYSELNNAMPYCVLAVNNPESSEDLINLCYALSNLYDAFN